MNEVFDRAEIDQMVATAAEPVIAPPDLGDDPDGWIATNIGRLKVNFPLWSVINVWIETKLGRAIQFLFNRMQLRLWALLLDDLRAKRPVRWYILKARQLGTTTWILILYLWLCSLRPNRNALLLNYDNKAAKVLGGRIQGFISRFLPALRPAIKTMNRETIHFDSKVDAIKKGGEKGLNSRIDSQTADAPTLGRSYTYHYALLSEFAFWPDLGLDIKERLGALNQAVPELPGTIIVIETTAKGENDAKAFWDDKNNGFRKIFISWLASDEYRRNLTDEEVLSFVLEDSEESRYGDERIERKKIAEQLKFWYSEHSGDETWLEREIVCRLQWRRETIDRKCLGDIRVFKSEYPTSPADAFAATGSPVFDPRDLDQARGEELKVARYRFDDDPEEDSADRKFYADKYGPLRVWKDPDPSKRYVIGGDCAQGIPQSGDESALVVLEVPSLEEVASYNEIITPDKFAAVAYWLGKLYNNALLGIENNEKGGYAALQVLLSVLFYPNLYQRWEGKALPKLGYHTNDQTKSVMVTDANGLLRDRDVTIHSEEILEQLRAFGVLKNKKLGARTGGDDLAMSWMIGVQLAAHVHEQTMHYERPAKGTFDWWCQRLPDSPHWGNGGRRGRRGRRKPAGAFRLR